VLHRKGATVQCQQLLHTILQMCCVLAAPAPCSVDGHQLLADGDAESRELPNSFLELGDAPLISFPPLSKHVSDERNVHHCMCKLSRLGLRLRHPRCRRR